MSPSGFCPPCDILYVPVSRLTRDPLPHLLWQHACSVLLSRHIPSHVLLPSDYPPGSPWCFGNAQCVTPARHPMGHAPSCDEPLPCHPVGFAHPVTSSLSPFLASREIPCHTSCGNMHVPYYYCHVSHPMHSCLLIIHQAALGVLVTPSALHLPVTPWGMPHPVTSRYRVTPWVFAHPVTSSLSPFLTTPLVATCMFRITITRFPSHVLLRSDYPPGSPRCFW